MGEMDRMGEMDGGWTLWTGWTLAAAVLLADAVEAFGEAAFFFKIFGKAGDLSIQQGAGHADQDVGAAVFADEAVAEAHGEIEGELGDLKTLELAVTTVGRQQWFDGFFHEPGYFFWNLVFHAANWLRLT